MINELLKYFPKTSKIREPRTNQIDALNLTWDAIQNKIKYVTLCAPTGSGKGALGITVMNYFNSIRKSVEYISPLNALTDQIQSEYNDVVTLKGKAHYNCIAKGNGIRCDSGYCANKTCYLTRNNPHEIKIKRECRTCQLPNCKCMDCEYKKLFRSFISSIRTNSNASLWLLGVIPDNLKVLIIDEVDSLEDFVRMSATVTVPFHSEGKFADHLSHLESYADSLEYCLDCEAAFNCSPKNYARHQGKIDVIRAMINDYEEYNEPWVIRTEFNQLNEPRTRYEPVGIKRFIDPKLKNLEFVLTMSATPPRWKDFEYIEVPSPFPVDIRQCIYHPLGRMSKDHRDENIPKLAEFLATLRGKTLVHCVSYSNAKKISDALRAKHVFPLLQVNKDIFDEDTVSRYDAVQAFKSSKKPNEILLSVNLNRGVDFYEPDIQNNIIPFIPFQNPTDSLVKAKTELLGEAWKDEATAITIEQSHGRIHRGIIYLTTVVKMRPDLAWLPTNAEGMVIKKTYITDSNFQNGKGRLLAWYSRNKQWFSNSFKETVKL